MVADACHEQKLDEMDEDDQPLVFKRNNLSAKQYQSNSQTKKSFHQKNDLKSERQAPGQPSHNGQSSSVKMADRISHPKESPVKSPTASHNSLSKALSVKPSELSENSLSLVAVESKSVKLHVKGEKSSTQTSGEADDSEDSEDNIPLSARRSASSTKGNTLADIKGPCKLTSVQKLGIPKKEDSDHENLSVSKFPLKSDDTVSSSRAYNSKGKANQNGSTSVDQSQKKPSSILKKRPQDPVKPENPTCEKKFKRSDGSTSIKNKEAVLKEPKAEAHEEKVPLSQRMKNQNSSDKKSSSCKKVTSPSLSRNEKSKNIVKNKSKGYSVSSKVLPGSGEGQKWTTLVHNGVIFPPEYVPHGVKMLYKGKPVELTPSQEEIATMFAVMIETDYMSKPMFKNNFFTDWRKVLGRNHVIQNLEDCDFTPIYEWCMKEREKKKQISSEEKKNLREEKLKQEEKYMWAVVDGVKEKVGNFRVEPPGLFRGRGEHPKMGKLKKRIRPSDIVINIGKDAPIPECPISGESWKEVRHDNTVTWLAFWNDPINQKEFKYVFLAPSSTLKGQSDKEKYEKARLLKNYIQGIRASYTKDFSNKDSTKKQIAVATYLIDKLALRAGNEKDDDEADTVGCCTLKVDNVEPVPPNILKFDFLGKDSIRYLNEVVVEPAVFKSIQQFRTGKKGGDDLFDLLDTSKLNAHLKELMPGLTAKVFRTYNASITLDDMLHRQTKSGEVAEKVAVYQHANKEVAIICNHQRTVSKSHDAMMTRMDVKINEQKDRLELLEKDLSSFRKGKSSLKSSDGQTNNLEKKINQTLLRIEKMERDKETREDLKTVALGTSKMNYLDPRITVAWCKRHEVPIEKIFNKTLLAKFAWAMDVDPEFRF